MCVCMATYWQLNAGYHMKNMDIFDILRTVSDDSLVYVQILFPHSVSNQSLGLSQINKGITVKPFKRGLHSLDVICSDKPAEAILQLQCEER